MSIRESLKRWEAFSHFTDEQLDLLEGCVSRTRYPQGAVVLSEGDSTFDAYLIDSGSVSIRRQTPYGEYVLATLEPGDLFGETAFVDRHTRSGDARAEEESELLAFNPVALGAQLRANQRLAAALHWTFWKSLAGKLRKTNERLTQFFGTPGDRVTEREPPPVPDDQGMRVDLASKRRLFAEQRLSNLEINFLASLSQERRLAPDQVIFHEGDSGDTMYVVLEGRIMISKYVPGAGEEALAFLERGDYFGEMALIDQKPRSADAKAGEEGAVVLAISREVLSGILDIEKLSSLALLELLCSLVAKRLRELDDKLIGWYILAGGGGTLSGGG